MKELANGIAQLAAIIMILITLAISTAAVSQWGNADNNKKAMQSVKASAHTEAMADTR